MEKYIILPDVTCELSAEMREYFGLKDYVRGHVHVDEKDIRIEVEDETDAKALKELFKGD